MADISSYLKKILEAIYGEEVRGSIHDALAAMNQESSSAMEFAATAKDSAAASAEKAKTEADTATQKASEALDSAGKAALSEAAAKASETLAKQYSDDAIGAANRAKESETNAANSEAVALQESREAEDAKNAAALSAAEAKAAEERVKTVKTEVETLGAQATADAKTAQAAKEAAEKAQAAAKLSETNAKDSETSALESKTAAETAKDEALAAKESAEEDALAAAQDKEDAENAKTAAEESASDAANSAVKAEQYSGKPPMPQNGTWWIWNADTGEYYDSHISCELPGPTGVGIDDIQLTSGDHSPGTTDIYTVLLTDGSSYNISVYNGLNGTGAGDVLGISFDLVIPASGWKDGSITIADSRLLALATHKYFLSADEACKEEFIDCNVQPKDITATGFITFTNESDPAMDLTVNLIRFELSGNGAIQ